MRSTSSVTDAVDQRRSIRAYLPTPVAEQTIRTIVRTALRAPSGGNVQPWRIDVVTGRPMDDLKTLMAARIATGEIEEPRFPVYPPDLWEPHRGYRYRVGEEMYALLDIGRDDREARARQFAANFTFFGAPVGLFFSIDRRFGSAQWADLGMMMQTVMLLAVEQGLGTCAQESWSMWPRTLRRFLDLADEQILFAGMAIGYPDTEAPVNQLRTERMPVDAVVFRGFESGDDR